jgi:hypothetical protein
MIPITPLLQQPILMRRLLIAIANPQDILTADRQLLNRPISKVLKSKCAYKTKLLRFLAERLERQYPIRHFFDPSVTTPVLVDPHLRDP